MHSIFILMIRALRNHANDAEKQTEHEALDGDTIDCIPVCNHRKGKRR